MPIGQQKKNTGESFVSHNGKNVREPREPAPGTASPFKGSAATPKTDEAWIPPSRFRERREDVCQRGLQEHRRGGVFGAGEETGSHRRNRQNRNRINQEKNVIMLVVTRNNPRKLIT